VSAFDATHTDKKLAAMQKADAERSRKQAKEQAQAGVTAAGGGDVSGLSSQQIDAIEQSTSDPALKAALEQAYQAQRQIEEAAEQEKHDALVKKQKDDFEEQFAELEKQAGGAKTEAQVKAVQDKIRALFKKYGITPGTVQAAGDWNAAQTLFVQGMGDLNKTMQALIAALNDLAQARMAAGIGPYGGSHAAGGTLPGHEGQPIPILAHANEYVIRSSAAKRLGVNKLNYMNATGNLPRFAGGGKIDPHTGTPDDPAYRASAMYDNDYGYDRNNPEIGTALAGLLGSRAQAQAAIRATTVGGVQLRHGLWRASGGVVDQHMLDSWKGDFPGITFETGTPGQQISWMQAASRLPMGGQEIGALIGASLGGSGTGANTRGSLVEQLTSHAVHFMKGGLIPAMATGGKLLSDGLFYGHEGERITPAKVNRGAGQVAHVTIELDKRVLGRAMIDFAGEQQRWGNPGISH
jgi:hypothetical protein